MDPEQLRDFLNHFYDPGYRLPAGLPGVLGLAADEGLSAARDRVLGLIASLKPPDDMPQDATAWRLYRVLQARYVHDLTQREAAEELAVTVRHLARLQDRAVAYLAEAIGRRDAATPPPAADAGGVRRQIAAEVTSLYEQADETTYEVAEVVQAAIELVMPQALAHHVALHFVAPAQPLYTSAPQAAVRQATLSALSYLLRAMHDGEVHMALRLAAAVAELEIEGGPVTEPCPTEPWLVQELLTTVHGELVCTQREGRLRLLLRLPPETEVHVLAIDDNSDQLHFYGRCVAGSRFRLQTLRDGRQALALARAALPDLLVLDVMLPNSDGWELLAQLANDPATRAIPIIVCSVVNEADLALSLGATVVLAKPVSRSAFLAALQQALQNGAKARH